MTFFPIRIQFFFFIALPLFFISQSSHANEEHSKRIIDDSQKAGEALEKKGNWIAVPIPISNPTIGTGLQGALIYLHPREGEDVPNITSGLVGMYTNTDSWFLGAFHDDNFVNDKYRLRIFGGYGRFVLDFFGVGDITSDSSIEYDFEGSILDSKFLVRLPFTENWYGGLQYQIVDTEVIFRIPSFPNIPEGRGNITIGALGIPLSYDSRNDNYYPTRGQYAEIRYLNYDKTWGSDFDYNKVKSFYNLYVPLQEKLVLAARARLENTGDNAPFFDLSTLDMRGFSRFRYLNDHSFSIHGEIRYKFLPRWGVVGFYETGWINDDFSRITSGTHITSYGGGIRWQVTSDKKLNLSVDFAESTDDQAIYIRVGEKF